MPAPADMLPFVMAMITGPTHISLQKQVDFLEANEDFALTFCNVLVKYEESDNKNHKGYQKEKMPSNNPIQTFPVPDETTDIYDIAKGNYIHTPGVVFLIF